jgi:hypothetical protein
MDRERFDRLARLVWTKHSRRAAVAALLGATLLRAAPAPAAARRKRRGGGRASAQAVSSCYPGARCTPGKGKNTSRCDFTGSTAFFQGNFRGANLSNSNFTGAQLAQADFRGANLSGACFVDANLVDARLGASVNLHQAVFCRTLMPDGTRNDRDCDNGTACCPTLCESCEDTCTDGIGAICSILGLPCCPDFVCTPDIIPVITTCQFRCSSDRDCLILDASGSLVCKTDAGACPFIGTCCQYARCSSDGDCPGGRVCCGDECHFRPCPQA